MNKFPLLAFSLLSIAVATSCDRRSDQENASASTATTSAAEATPGAEQAASPVTSGDATDSASSAPAAADDSLALGLLGTVNDNEIKAAQQAMSKKVSGPVMDYARMMEKEHTDNLVATRALGPLADNADVQAMKEKGARELADLGKKNGKDYETAYVDAMVKDHTEALALIDDRLLALSSAGPVRDHLTKTRGHVAMHLEAAQKLQAGNK